MGDKGGSHKENLIYKIKTRKYLKKKRSREERE